MVLERKLLECGCSFLLPLRYNGYTPASNNNSTFAIKVKGKFLRKLQYISAS